MTLYQCPTCKTVRFLSEKEVEEADQPQASEFYPNPLPDDCPACSCRMDPVEGQSS